MMKILNIIRNICTNLLSAGRRRFASFDLKGSFLLLLSFLMLFQASHNYRLMAAFNDDGAGARAPGMANTFTGVADDANALHYNPAGLTQLREAEVTTFYGKFLTGLGDNSNLSTTYLGYGQPLRSGNWGVLGLGFKSFKADNLLSERTIYLSYGWKLKTQPFDWPGTWSMGTTLKQLHHSFEPDRFAENALNDAGTASGRGDPLFKNAGLAKTAYAFDVSSFYRFGPKQRYSAGLMFMNLNRPDVSIGGDSDKAPFISKFGLGYRPRWGLVSVEFRKANRLASQSDTEFSLGAERKFELNDLGAFTLRGGYAEGSRGYQAFTAGLSYLFSKAQIDYAFNFPIGNLSDVGGSHRVGFTFKFGLSKNKEDKAQGQFDLIAAFASDPETAYVAVKRAAESLYLTDHHQFLLMQILLKKYANEDLSTKDIREDLTRIMTAKEYQLMDWASIKAAMFMNANRNDVGDLEDALSKNVSGDPSYALARTALMSQQTKTDRIVRTMNILGHAELAAQAFRAKNIDNCLDHVKQILEIIPKDEVILIAYRQLLLLRVQSNSPDLKAAESALPTDKKMRPGLDSGAIELPEAPAALVAPKPIVQDREGAVIILSDFDKTVRGFGTALGYYFTRKSEKAPVEERAKLLKQMKAQYSGKGIDMSVVEKELNELASEIEMSKMERPAEPKIPAAIKSKPSPKKSAPAPKKRTPTPSGALKTPPSATTAAPSAAGSIPELERQWDYYQQAVRRGVSGHERIEILESIKSKFGEVGAEKVRKELEKLKKRAEQ